ncbi:MAG: hypothetical protein Q8Q09_10525 [Deltaproteobacteria bacterium]|nr:hypothetical protein [Deltaproteobacteria bacterium]
MTTMLGRGWMVAVLVGAQAMSCAPGTEPTEENNNPDFVSDEVTDVSHTIVKNQTIGNCWAYATATWAESLHRRWAEANATTSISATTYRNAEINISESWITFWDWYGKVSGTATGVTTTNGRSEVSTGGWWDSGSDTLRRRGVVFEADFIPEEANAQSSQRQRSALAALNTELNMGGRLATAADRADRTKVFTVLMDVWQLNEGVRSTMLRVYGATGSGTVLSSTTTDLGFVRKARDIRVRTPVLRSGRVVMQDTNLEAVTPGGTYAWRNASYSTYTSGQTSFHQRVMRALNEGAPVLISWLVDFNLRQGAVFSIPMPVPAPGRQGGHLTVLEDYEVTVRQPGQPERILRAGEMATRADMDLAVRFGSINFYRIKNSWGTGLDPSMTGNFMGYYDLHLNYLNGPIRWTEGMSTRDRTPLSTVVMPPGF